MKPLLRQFEDLLGLDAIPMPQPIDTDIRMPSLRPTRETSPAATPEDAIARKAAAAIEREEGFDRCAENRLRGAYDGDSEHRIALKAIEIFKQSRKSA